MSRLSVKVLFESKSVLEMKLRLGCLHDCWISLSNELPVISNASSSFFFSVVLYENFGIVTSESSSNECLRLICSSAMSIDEKIWL